jgi:uncharacterized RDD family membrane protein YckC
MERTAGAIALEFAGFWRRLAAFAVDAVVLGVISSMLFPFSWIGWGRLWDNQWYWTVLPLLMMSGFFNLAIYAIYHAGFWAWRGQTPGKMLLNIRLIRTNGNQVTLGYALLRYLGYIISGALMGVGFLWIAFDPHKQGLHDKVADTYVIKLPEMPLTQPALTRHSEASAG